MNNEQTAALTATQQAAPNNVEWKDSNTAKLVNELRDTAIQFRDAQQLRERIAHIIRPLTDLLEASTQREQP